jgi:hypothetical protein
MVYVTTFRISEGTWNYRPVSPVTAGMCPDMGQGQESPPISILDPQMKICGFDQPTTKSCGLIERTYQVFQLPWLQIMYPVLGLPESPRCRSVDQLAIEDSEDEVC